MKRIIVYLFALLFLLTSSVITYAAGNKDRYVEKNNFSIAVPETWDIVTIKGLKYKILRGALDNNFAPTINFVDEKYNGQLDKYTEYFMDQIDSIFGENKEYLFFGEIITLKKLTGKLIVITSFQQEMLIQFNYFIFPKNNGSYIIITCSNLADENAKFYEIFINTVRTFELL
ncbi:MAG: hypothetical protein LBC76_09060 [Treponema sp.]|nr:hypothetical protein [Treponema sp.]